MTTTLERSAVRTNAPQRHRRKLLGAPWILLAPFLALFALTVLVPVILAVVQSFTHINRAGLFGEQGVTGGFAGSVDQLIEGGSH